MYQGKCDKCGGQDPQAYVEVYTNPKPGTSGVSEFWCINCLREEKKDIQKDTVNPVTKVNTKLDKELQE